MKTLPFALAALLWLTSPTVAAAESWILWESVEERRLHPVDSPFPSQATCVSRGRARIAQYRQQDKFKKPGVISDVTDGGLTFSIRWQVTSDTPGAAATDRASIEKTQAMYERELARQTELAEIRQELYERGTLSAKDVQLGRQALAKAQKDVDDIRRQRVEVDRMLSEAKRPPAATWTGFTALRYQCWPVGVNP